MVDAINQEVARFSLVENTLRKSLINLFNDLGIDLSYITFVVKHLSLVISLDSELENLALENFLKYEQLKAMAMTKKDALPVYTKMKIEGLQAEFLFSSEGVTSLKKPRLRNIAATIWNSSRTRFLPFPFDYEEVFGASGCNSAN